MTTYEEAQNMVKNIESAAQQQGSFEIDPSDIAPGIEVRTLNYSSAIRLIGFAKQERQEEQLQAQPAEQLKAEGAYARAQGTATEPKQAHAAAQPSPSVQPSSKQMPQPAQQQKAEAKTNKPRPALFKKELHDAAGKLESIGAAGTAIGRSIGEAREQRRLKGLVLPTLSLNDQISDLEKIDEGLKERVFNSEQLKIIRLEANGLARLIAEGKQKAVPTDLAELRNALLKEVIDEANAYVV
ncbi:MAG: hypothetical protein QXT43_00580 [Candidatus Micrarchaeaceae archaeon]